MITNKLREDDETFYETEQLASSVNVPVLMIHSPDDALVSFDLGQKLLRSLRALSKAPVHFYKADETYSLGHRYVFKDPKLQDAVADFIRQYGNGNPPRAKTPTAEAIDRDEPTAIHPQSQNLSNEDSKSASKEIGQHEEEKEDSTEESASPERLEVPEDEL